MFFDGTFRDAFHLINFRGKGFGDTGSKHKGKKNNNDRHMVRGNDAKFNRNIRKDQVRQIWILRVLV